MIGFHNVRFPEDISWGSAGGPQFKTQIYESYRGYEKRNIDWAQPQMKFDVQYGVKTDVQMLRLIEFFNARQGMAYGFRYKNWANYRIINGPIATGDGYSTRLPMWKFYGFHGSRMYKRLRKIVTGSVTSVGVAAVGGMTEGVDFNIDYDAGEIALNYAPGYGIPVYAGNLEFDEPVRFDVDSIQAVIDGYNNQSLQSLDLIGVKGTFEEGSIFAPNQDASGSDDFFESVRLILNFDDISTLTTTVDQSELAVPVTFNNDATLVTTTLKHGEGSFYGGTNGYLSLSGLPYFIANLPFTLEMFLTQPGTGPISQTIIGKWDSVGTNKCWTLRFIQATKQLQFVVTEDGTTEQIILNFPWTTAREDVFDYITIDRLSSGYYVLRINGQVKQSVKLTNTVFDNSTPLVIAGQATPGANEGTYQGNMDSIRLTIGRNRNHGFGTINIPTPYPV